MSFFGLTDPNAGYQPGSELDKRFVPQDNEYGPSTRLIWFDNLQKIENDKPFENKLDFYKANGEKLGKFIYWTGGAFFFLPKNKLDPNKVLYSLHESNNAFRNLLNYKNKVGLNDKIYYFDPYGEYSKIYGGGERRRTKARRKKHRSRRSRRRAKRTRRRYYY